MHQSLHFLLAFLFLVLLVLPLSHQAPQAWQPQGRFGKRAAWRPQSRFGKRLSDDISPFSELDGGISGLKRAWRPQSRFGKREPGVDDVELLSLAESLAPISDQDIEMGKKWRPQGRFGKRGEEEADEANVVMTGIDGEEVEKRAWRPQSRFGKRRLAAQRWQSMIDSLKRAWRPQGRFGKRSSGDEEGQDVE